MSRVGEKVKAARTSRNMSQKQLAKKLGVAESYIQDVELGRKIINEGMISRLSKVLSVDLNDVSMVATDEDLKEENKLKRPNLPESKSLKSDKAKGDSEEIWNQAFGSVLKNVPVYDYSFEGPKGSKKLPVESNKIEGFSADKVFYIEIEEDDMIGYRIAKGDLALCHGVKELEGSAIYLLDYNNKRAVRQVKKLDNSKVLLLSNGGTVKTETIGIKEIRPVARLLKLEIKL
ncbi:MAG: helix-turn-helix domain-containing protein [Clostridiaceae bacterium]